MKSKTLKFAVSIVLLVEMATPFLLAAQNTRFKLIDMGTFGGPASYLTDPGNGLGFLVLNDAGVLVGRSQTSTPFPLGCGTGNDCFLAHAFRWDKGVLSDLGTPAGAIFTQASGVNARGWIAIDYSTGEIDPLTGGPIFRGALLKEGQFIEIPPLGEGIENNALYVNNAGQVVGFSSISTTPDPTGFSFIGGPIHPFLWQNGVSHDLGTLGGPDAIAFNNCNNQRANLVTGVSLLADSVTLHPFLWHNGRMTDLGTLGGSIPGDQFGSFIPSQCANDAGKVSGSWTLPGDLVIHAFLWEGGIMRDLGTLGGHNSLAQWMNEAGDVVGEADLPDSEINFLHHAFLWRSGTMIDLGALGSTSKALAINASGQVVGKSRLGDDPFSELQHAFLWENGGPMVDLNTLIGPNSPLELYDGENINDAGWIAGRGLPPGCGNKDQCGHAFLLIPCHPASGQDCSPVTAIAPQFNAAVPNKQTTRSAQLRLTPPQSLATRGVQLPQRYRFRGVTTSKD